MGKYSVLSNSDKGTHTSFVRWCRASLVSLLAVLMAFAAAIVPAAPSSATGVLSKVGWSASSSVTSASSVKYTFEFQTASGASLTSITMGVPSGTGGTPSVANVSVWAGYAISLSSPTATLSSSVLTLSFGSTYVPSGAVVSIQFGGLTNTATSGSYVSSITTKKKGAAVDSGASPGFDFTVATLADTYGTASTTVVSAPSVTYTYGFVTGASETASSITLSLPPGTSGSPAVGSVSPVAVSGGSVSLSAAGILTYTFASTTLNLGASVAIQVTGLTNTPTVGSYSGELAVLNGAAPVESASVSAMTFTSAALTDLSFSASSTSTGAAGVSYTFGFTTATSQTLSSFTMTVPPGTSGSPTVGSATAQAGYSIALASPTASLSGTAITFSFTSVYLPAATVVSIQITGLANTSTAGSYESSMATFTSVSSALPEVDSGVSNAVTFTSTALASLSWSASSTSTGTAGVSYTYDFDLTGTATLTSVTMSVPPGTGGTPVVGTVTPASVAGGTVTLAGQLLTYSFTSTSVSPSTTVSIQITGLTNTSTAGGYASTITAYDGSNAIASGATPSVSFTSAVLTNLSWSASSTLASATGVTYTYQMTTGSSSNLSSIEMTVPSGTSGSPAVASATAQSSYSIAVASPTVSLAGTMLKLAFTSVYIPAGTVVVLQFTGIINTSTPGSYTSSISTYNGAAPVDSGTSPVVSFNSTVLGSPTWLASSNAIGAGGTAYTYSFGFPDSAVLTTVTMTVPSGTGGTPAVGTVTPVSVAGGTVTLAGQLLTYTFPAASVNAGSTISIEITGLTNTSSAGSYSSTITSLDSGTAVASGATPAVTFTSTVLTGLSWSASSAYTAATGVGYTFGFTTSSSHTLTEVTMTVPPGTAGTPAVGTVSAGGVSVASPTISLSGTTLIFSFSSVYVPSGTAFSIGITGLTNTATAGPYTSAISTQNGGATIDSGTTPALDFYAASVSLVPPSSLSWAAGLDINSVSTVDQVSGDQQYSVSDLTGTGNGWNVTVSATTFTNGTHTLPDLGTFSTNGSTVSSTSTSMPTVTCISTCVSPTNDVTYPVLVTTAPSSPASFVIFSAATGTGSGSFTIGGSSSLQPVGWWLTVPPNVYAGSYTSIITLAIGSGP